MPVVIRLQRHGSTHRPFYAIVAADSRAPRDGKFIEKLGYYDPNPSEAIINVNAERVQYWFGMGAQLSDQTRALMKRKKIELKRAKTHKPRRDKGDKDSK